MSRYKDSVGRRRCFKPSLNSSGVGGPYESAIKVRPSALIDGSLVRWGQGVLSSAGGRLMYFDDAFEVLIATALSQLLTAADASAVQTSELAGRFFESVLTLSLSARACSRDSRPNLTAAIVSDGDTRSGVCCAFMFPVSASRVLGIRKALVLFCGDLRPRS